MDQVELQKMFEADAELNSPEVQAANAELQMCLEQQEQMAIEPLQAKPRIPYTDTADFGEKLSQIEQSLQDVAKAQETERQARIDAEERAEQADRKQIRESRIWQTVIVIIGVLTLAATIFGVLKQ